jgi:hypothetical protein
MAVVLPVEGFRASDGSVGAYQSCPTAAKWRQGIFHLKLRRKIGQSARHCYETAISRFIAAKSLHIRFNRHVRTVSRRMRVFERADGER